VKSDTAPTLIIHGEKDDLVPLQQSEIFISKLKEHKVPCDLIVKKGAGHGWPTLLGDLPAFADWFDKHLAGNGPDKNARPTASASDKSVSLKPLTPQDRRVGASGKVADANWPQYRGARSLGTSTAANLPDSWSTTENIAWKTPIPGRGWSCPIVWGDKVFVTTVVSEKPPEAAKKGLYLGGDRKTPPTDPHKWVLICLDLKTGKKLWEQVAAEGVPDSSRHIKNSYASETPVTDGERVYAYFGNHGLYCYDLNGKQLWSKKLGTFRTKLGWGTAASPVLHKDRLIVVHDNEDDSFMIALDAKTGNELWRVARDEKSNWATPFVWENELRTELVTNGTGKVRSYDLDGKLLWELAGMSSITIPTPFAAHGMLYLASGYVMHNHRPVYAVRPGAAGDVSLKNGELKNDYIVWYQKLAAPYNPSPLVYGDYFYVLKDRGMLSCYDAKTGAEIYKDQRLGAGEFTASPWAYDGKVFCLSESGDTFVIQAGPEFKIVGRNKLDELCMATPAIAGDRLLIRTESQVYCIKK
jgi:outer membrane protein assembly factor BamB